ncbi:McrB family protein [Aeromonas veronii]|uniref:McrB family protein n=1 Tax=Aeromonas veronii TaxID=654 RepID=UPI0038DAE615
MGLHLSKELLALAINGFKSLANHDEVRQGVTQDVSAIRHCFALDRVLNKNSLKTVKLQYKTDRFLQEFINNVGDIVKLNDSEGHCEYTTNFINDIKEKSDFGVGSNLLSAGVAPHSPLQVQTYPKKTNKGLILIDNYNFSLKDDYIETLKGKYNITRIGFSFLIWLNRFNEFSEEDNSPERLFNKLKGFVCGEYSPELSSLISYSTSEDFEKYTSEVSALLHRNKANLAELFEVKNNHQEESEPAKIAVAKSQLPKTFILLAGISGTGKTRFVREQVGHNTGLKNYCLVPVRPDWHEPSDLLGYISRLGGKTEYIPTPVLKFIVQAWNHIIENIHEADVNGKIYLDWEGKNLDNIDPFWLCLDEMNLAPVEQYFADYLSVLETRHWYTPAELAKYNAQEGVEYEYVYECDPLLKPDVLALLDNTARNELAKQLGMDLSNVLQKEIWDYFCQHGIAIPFNLMVAGTVNMDETTHGFSRKVIDRALTFDFNEFFPNDFDAYFAPTLQPKLLGYPTWSDGRAITEVPELEQYSKESVTFLKAVNKVLQQTPFELAYRALNELMLALLAHHPASTAELVAIWDDFMMCKVLPRIEGDSDKLRSHHTTDGNKSTEGSQTEPNLLTDLEKVLAEQFGSHWDDTRPDLFNCKVAAADEDSIPAVPCRSKKKLAWMKERLTGQCFTSFWP